MKITQLKLWISLATVTLLSFATLSHAESVTPTDKTGNQVATKYAGESTKFAIMTSNKMQFMAAVGAATQMQPKQNNYTFEIVVVGGLAKDLVEDKSLTKFFDDAEKTGVNLVVCEVALNAFKVNKEKLDKRFSITKNGWVHMFELKDNGFNTLSAN